MKIAHLSDLHFGRIVVPGIVDHLIQDIHQMKVALVAVSGDLTQRAYDTQFRQARAMLEEFLPPVIVVPGNHDVYPWWRPASRLFRPLHRYQKHFGAGFPVEFKSAELVVLGINSAHGKTIKGGRITSAVNSRVDGFFRDVPDGTFKVLMLHHHLRKLSGLSPHDVARGGESLLDTACQTGVNLILCGHMHISHVESLPCRCGGMIPVASAGTATSDRGRRSNKKRNFYNLIDIQAGSFEVQERAYSLENSSFFTERRTFFER